jgi:hypothetical protein
VKSNSLKNVCRACSSSALEFIHDFGVLPVADKLMLSLEDKIPSFPLSISVCTNCFLLQINEDVDPEVLFRNNYPYYSSQIPEVKRHFNALYQEVKGAFQLDKEDVIVEIAGNDGVLLNCFKGEVKTLINIEPSLGPAEVSENLGLETIKSFFSFDIAKSLKPKLNASPRLIFAANVFAHVPNPMDFVKGLNHIAGDSTTIIIEVPHVMPMLENTLFDVIFHQHFSYFSLFALKKLFESNELFINDVKQISTQGGSLRLFISKNKARTLTSVQGLLEEELTYGIKALSTFHNFSKRIVGLKETTLSTLKKLKQENKKIVGYGAPGKAATLLNYYQIDKAYLEYIVDLSPSKQGFIFPFTGMKIYPVEKLLEDKPEVVLILVWNYKTSIIAYLKDRLPKDTVYLSIL